MWSIALKTLVSDKGKCLTALLGVVFCVVLVNIQGGLFLGFIDKISLLIDNADADLWVGHRHVHNVDMADDIPRRWVYRIRGVDGVLRADPYLLGWATMSLPDGAFEGVVVIGCDRTSLMGNARRMSQGSPEDVLQTDGIIVDELERSKLGDPQVGDLREINGHRARVVGMSRGIMGFLIAPYVFTTMERARAYLNKDPELCSYFLVDLEPGADADAVAVALRQRVPELDVHTRDGYARKSIAFWLTRTGLGISFGAATAMGLAVGMVIVGQTLYAAVLDRLSEFGALKAMGAQEWHIYGLLFSQAVAMAGAGAIVGLALVVAIHWGFSTPQSPINVPWWLSLGSCGVVAVICLVSSVLPYVRVRRVDPLMVLQS